MDRLNDRDWPNGLEAQKILTVLYGSGRRIFIIKFHGVELPRCVFAEVANIQIPQMVIQFYEKITKWVQSDDDINQPPKNVRKFHDNPKIELTSQQGGDSINDNIKNQKTPKKELLSMTT